MQRSLPERQHQLIDAHLRRTHTWLDRTLGQPTTAERNRQQREDLRRLAKENFSYEPDSTTSTP